MTCPWSGETSETTTSNRGLERRSFLRAAVAIGGSNALSACIEREADGASVGNTSENGNEGRPPEQQFGWKDSLHIDGRGVPLPPRHHALLFLDYRGYSTPTQQERTELENAFQELEKAYAWSHDGLLFTVGYSPYYFDRFDQALPESVDVPKPRVLEEPDSPELDTEDVVIHLASDKAQAVLGAEEALFNGMEEVNGIQVDGDVSHIFRKKDRRTGFIGSGMPAERQDVEGIPDNEPVHPEAPMYMGFHSQNMKNDPENLEEDEMNVISNQATEERVKIDDGPFEGGTTQHISLIRHDLDDWYNEFSLDERVGRMVNGNTDVSDVGEVMKEAVETGFPDFREKAAAHRDEYGFTGHADKVARSRNEAGEATLLRRDFNTTDGGHAGVHFVSLQEKISDFVETRKFMTGRDLIDEEAGVGETENNGILEFITVKRRANFLIPPRSLRSLPPARP